MRGWKGGWGKITELSVGGEEAEKLGKRPAGRVENWWMAPKHFRLQTEARLRRDLGTMLEFRFDLTSYGGSIHFSEL